MKKYSYLLLIALVCCCANLKAENGYRLWLRYDKINNTNRIAAYRQQIKQLVFPATSATLRAAKKELLEGLNGLTGIIPAEASTINALNGNNLLIGSRKDMPGMEKLLQGASLETLGSEGFILQTINLNGKRSTVIMANTDVGVLYGVFYFLKLLQTERDITVLNITDKPAIKHRVLNHWDNLDRTVERGYAGSSIWNWHKLPGYIDPRYIDYARANASIGINGTVVNNVNTNALSLTKEYLIKTAALANALRPYGIRIYLSARFSAPVEIGGLKTADPLDAEVRKWWKDKIDEIYTYIPDFGGFLVKANSEGQPGPQNYGRNHADGANMMADALKPHNGIVMWRAFVYDNKVPDDRAKQAYNEFKPLDGHFRENVLIQVKNGPIDFQPREPFHPLFGAMPKTPLMMEFQLTQEYLGFATHLVYLAPLFKETLASDTYAKGKGSTVAKVIDGQLEGHELSGMAGVSNIGSDVNWTGHPFAQANWYAYGRLAWNPELNPAAIADEWIRMTFSNDASFIAPVKTLMLNSRETVVNYMTPLGLHHIMGRDHHYGPGPWVKDAGRADWTSVYYHRADAAGIGFNRSSTGSKATEQYFAKVRDQFNDVNTIPEQYLLWFHHVNWDHKLPSGESLWDELVNHYYTGVQQIEAMRQTWDKMKGKVDNERFQQVKQLLDIQASEAELWRDACVLYFQQFSKRPIPAGFTPPQHSLEYYENLKYNFVPGIKGVQ
jgi:alpha-glucuronidase